jgi:hypothetical protein
VRILVEKRTSVSRVFHHERAKRRLLRSILRADFPHSGRSLLRRSKRAPVSLVEKGGIERQSMPFGAQSPKQRSVTRQRSP